MQNENQKKYIISVENLVKEYSTGNTTQKIIKDVTFNIVEGSFVAIVGKSGSGKSTLLNLISGLVKPTSGKINVNGNYIHKLNGNKLVEFRKNNVSFIFQDYGLLKTLTVQENVMAGACLTKKSKKKDIIEILKYVEIYEYRKKFPQELSGGQQQRVSIARAISKQTPIIFADEPTGALDSEKSYKIIKLLKKINKEKKVTVVIITHDLRITKVADKVIELLDGKIINNYENKPLEDFENLFIS